MGVKRPLILQRRELHQHHFDEKSGVMCLHGDVPKRYDATADKLYPLTPGELFRFESFFYPGGGFRFLGIGHVLKDGRLSVTHIGSAPNHPHTEAEKIILEKLKKPHEPGVDASPENYNSDNHPAGREHGFKEYVTTFKELEQGWKALNGSFRFHVVTPKPKYVRRSLWKKLLSRA